MKIKIIISGETSMSIDCWRPISSSNDTTQEMKGIFLGLYPTLSNDDVVHGLAWKDRCHFVTASSGEVLLNVHTVCRFWNDHNIN